MIYAHIFACFIPLIAFIIIFFLLVPQIKVSGILFSCILGLLCVIPIALLQIFLAKVPLFNRTNIWAVFFTALIFNGLVEEFVKMLLMLPIPAKTKILAPFFSYTVLFGISLASFENVIYLVNGTGDFLLRMMTSMPIHAVCAALGGLYVWSWRKKEIHITPFIYAVIIHGVYNFFAAFPWSFKLISFVPMRSFSIIAILFGIIECRIWYKNLCQLH